MNLSVKIGKLKLKNPVLLASGTFGYAEEFEDFIKLEKLGAIVTKTITLAPRVGNPPPRIVETASGMLNSIGLENPGVNIFIKEKLPVLKKIGVPIIVSISADKVEEFVKLAKRLDKEKAVSAIELNISCPNIVTAKTQKFRQNAKLISQDPESTYKVVEAVRKVTKLTLITKLSPNVTDITQIAKAAEGAGTDALSLVNTFFSISIDVNTRRSHLGNVIGGLSGPAIKPVALYMVREVAKKTKLPIIGMGGIVNAEDALEFIIAGASAVAVGTANFINPKVSIEIIAGIKDYSKEHKISSIKRLVGSLKT
jgi:dihydroorotate dehydrogenase (NAD+) catalytic subunit